MTCNEYPFLRELGITEENLGCYYGGKWTGSGPVYTSVNPTTGKPIARIRMSTAEEYE